MDYLITGIGFEPFLSKWFNPDNHFNAEVKMVVYDLWNNTYTTDGKTWKPIAVDHL